MNESLVENKIERSAEHYYNKYKNHMQLMEKSSFARVRSVTPFDYYALGKQLDQFNEMLEMFEAQGTVSDLGTLPKIALDVITVAFGTSPLNIIGTVQPKLQWA